MPRSLRKVIVGLPHHLTQRGNHRQDVFSSDADRLRYLALLHEYAGRYGVDIWAYCLMTNHVHIVGVPRTELALTRMVQMTHMRHTQRMNQTNGWVGHLWQSRFFACAMDEAYCWAAIRYVEQNPVRAGLVTSASEYPWSSASAHCGLREDPLLTPIPHAADITEWTTWLTAEDPIESAGIRQHTLRGHPYGSETFLTALATRLGSSVLPRPRGRPKKEEKD